MAKINILFACKMIITCLEYGIRGGGGTRTQTMAVLSGSLTLTYG